MCSKIEHFEKFLTNMIAQNALCLSFTGQEVMDRRRLLLLHSVFTIVTLPPKESLSLDL